MSLLQQLTKRQHSGICTAGLNGVFLGRTGNRGLMIRPFEIGPGNASGIVGTILAEGC
jgi:hypothetical protein